MYFLNGPDAHRGVMFAGDTAQTIASGVNFKFSELRRLHYDKFLPHCRKTDPILDAILQRHPGDDGKLVPRVKFLTENFRSTQYIIELAAALVQLLYNFFPAGIDKVERENAQYIGVKPIYLATQSVEGFLANVLGQTVSKNVRIEFGADQVILVRNEITKERVRKDVGNAIILTVEEVKGLEYEVSDIFPTMH